MSNASTKPDSPSAEKAFEKSVIPGFCVRCDQTIALDDIVMVAEAPDRAEVHGRDHCFSITTTSRVFCMRMYHPVAFDISNSNQQKDLLLFSKGCSAVSLFYVRANANSMCV